MCLVCLPGVVAVCLLDQIEEVPHNSLEISIKCLLQYYCINTFGSYYVELHSPLNGHIFTKQIMFGEQRVEDGLGARNRASFNYDIVILFTSGTIVSISTCQPIPSFMTDDNGEVELVPDPGTLSVDEFKSGLSISNDERKSFFGIFIFCWSGGVPLWGRVITLLRQRKLFNIIDHNVS